MTAGIRSTDGTTTLDDVADNLADLFDLLARAGLRLASDYPLNAQAVANSATAAAANAVATLAADQGKTLYLAGVQINASGATSGVAVNATITGLVGGTMNIAFTFPAGVLVPAQPVNITFKPPLPALGPNIAIVGTLPSGGSGNTQASISLQGYKA